MLRRRRNVRVILSSVTGFDLERRIVHTTSLPGRFDEYPYDSLIVSAGAGQSYFGHDEFALIAPGMKTIDDAMELRRRVYGALELAETMRDEALERFWMTFVDRRAPGPPGSNWPGRSASWPLAASAATSERSTLLRVRVILVDGGTEPLATFGGELSERASRTLEKMGVELQMGLRVVGVDPFGVDTENERRRRAASRPGPRSGPPGSRRRRWPACWPRPRGRRRIGPGVSRSSPTSPSRTTPKSSRWGTWRRSTTCRASPRWPCRAACTRATPSSAE